MDFYGFQGDIQDEIMIIILCDQNSLFSYQIPKQPIKSDIKSDSPCIPIEEPDLGDLLFVCLLLAHCPSCHQPEHLVHLFRL